MVLGEFICCLGNSPLDGPRTGEWPSPSAAARCVIHGQPRRQGLRYMTSEERAARRHRDGHEEPRAGAVAADRQPGVTRALKVLKVAKNKLVGHEHRTSRSPHLQGYDCSLRALSARLVENLASGLAWARRTTSTRARQRRRRSASSCTGSGATASAPSRTTATTCAPTSRRRGLLSRLSALKEYAFMKALHDKGFPTPTPIDVNRHCVLMSSHTATSSTRSPTPPGRLRRADATDLQAAGSPHPLRLQRDHLLVDDEERVTMIDFPQMADLTHKRAVLLRPRRRVRRPCAALPLPPRFGPQQALGMADGTARRSTSSWRRRVERRRAGRSLSTWRSARARARRG